MLRQCAWCGSVLGQAEPLEMHDITHGICIACSIRMLKEAALAARDQSRCTQTKNGLSTERRLVLHSRSPAASSIPNLFEREEVRICLKLPS